MDIEYTVKTVYGTELYYPYNETTKGLCELLGSKTLTTGNLQQLQKLGFKIYCMIEGIANVYRTDSKIAA